jgi:hypothetical protein
VCKGRGEREGEGQWGLRREGGRVQMFVCRLVHIDKWISLVVLAPQGGGGECMCYHSCVYLSSCVNMFMHGGDSACVGNNASYNGVPVGVHAWVSDYG